ncbi:MAG: hypothetical protein ACRDKG_00155 [Actinomycetota bacterium]
MNLVLAFIEDRRLGLAAMGALAVVVGSALPWLYVPQPLIGSSTGYGLQDEGKITVILGVLALVLLVAYARVRGRDLVLGALACGLGAAGLTVWYASRTELNAARVIARLFTTGGTPLDPSSVVPFPARIAAGVWVVLAGAAVLVLCSAALSLRGNGRIGPALRSPS